MAHIIHPTFALAAAATSSLSMLASLVAPNSVMSSASPVRLLTASALLSVAVSEDGHAKSRSEEMLASGGAFLSESERLGVSVLDLPTAYWHELVMNTTEEDWASLTGLRLMVIGGERVRDEDHRQGQRDHAGRRLPSPERFA